MKQLFTASQIGAAIGKTRHSARRALDRVPRTGIRPDFANADAWSIEALPDWIRADLRAVFEREKMRAGYRTLADVLRNPPDRWSIEIPLAEVHEQEIAAAQCLQRALARGLALRAGTSDSERARAVADDYRREFGHSVSERHLRNLIRRTLDRDREAGELHRLELYLPDAPRRRDASGASACAGLDFSPLEVAFSVSEDLVNPTVADREHCWKSVIAFWNDLRAGETPRGARGALLSFLNSTLPRLAKTPEAMERAFERRRKVYAEDAPQGLADKREESGRAGTLPERYPDEMEKLKAEVKALKGDISQAFRNLMRGTARSGVQFGDEFKSIVAYDPRQRKSYVPASIRRFIRCWWKAVFPFTKGARAVQAATPACQLDWSAAASGDSYSGDDFTFNHPFYIWDDTGEFEAPDGRRFNWTRGQVLLFNDEKSRKILGRNAIPQRTYNSSHIHQGLAELCLDPRIGLPFMRFHLEQSLWAAKVVEGMVSWTKIEGAFKDTEHKIELDLVHANTAQAKSIESIGNRIQAIMEAAPFYVGRNERLDNYEREQAFVAKLKGVGQPRKEAVHPAKMMMSWEEFLVELDRCIEVYNNDPQDGPTMRGDTGHNRSPEEVWAQESGLRMHEVLPASLTYLLSTCVSRQTVQSRGVRAPGSEIWYSDSTKLGELIGEKVSVRFNPRLPEIVMVCHLARDPKERAPFAVGVGPIMPALGATPEQFAAARAKQKRFMSYGQAQFKAFAPKRNATIRREQLGTPDLRATGDALNAIEQEHRDAKKTRDRHAGQIARLADRHNLLIDLPKDRDPEQTRGYLEELEEIESRITAREALDESDGAGAAKSYKLFGPPQATRKQREAIYWTLWKQIEGTQPKLQRAALTHRTLGSVPAVPQQTTEQLEKMILVFGSIARDRLQPSATP